MVSLDVLGPGVCPGTLTLPTLSGLLILPSSLGEEAQPKLLLLCPTVLWNSLAPSLRGCGRATGQSSNF